MNALIRKLSLAAACGMLLGSAPLGAQIVESFDYPLGPLNTQGSAADDGWNSAWSTGTQTWELVEVSSTELAPGFTGQSIRMYRTGGGGSIYRSEASRSFDQTHPIISYGKGESTFFSFLLYADDVSLELSDRTEFLVSHPSGGGNWGLNLNPADASLNAFLRNGGSVSFGTLESETLYHIVMEFVAGTGVAGPTLKDSLYVWINPESDLYPGQGTADGSLVNVGENSGYWTATPFPFSSLRLQGVQHIDGRSTYFDEIKIGTTWEDVFTVLQEPAPVIPEPSSALLAAVGALALLRARRRKR